MITGLLRSEMIRWSRRKVKIPQCTLDIRRGEKASSHPVFKEFSCAEDVNACCMIDIDCIIFIWSLLHDSIMIQWYDSFPCFFVAFQQFLWKTHHTAADWRCDREAGQQHAATCEGVSGVSLFPPRLRFWNLIRSVFSELFISVYICLLSCLTRRVRVKDRFNGTANVFCELETHPAQSFEVHGCVYFVHLVVGLVNRGSVGFSSNVKIAGSHEIWTYLNLMADHWKVMRFT